MLRMYFGLSVVNTEAAIHDSQAFRAFMRIDLSLEAAPNATMLLKFRRLLETHRLTERIFRPYQPPLVALLGLMHLGVTRASVVFGGAGCGNQHSVHWWLAQALRSGPHQVGGQPGVCAVTTRRTRCCLRRTPGPLPYLAG